MHLDRKLNSTIIDVKPRPTRSLIHLTTGTKGASSLGTSTQLSCLPVRASVGSTRWS
jgi:hypothetical protein